MVRRERRDERRERLRKNHGLRPGGGEIEKEIFLRQRSSQMCAICRASFFWLDKWAVDSVCVAVIRVVLAGLLNYEDAGSKTSSRV